MPAFTAPENPVFSPINRVGISLSLSHWALPSSEPLSTTRMSKSL